MPRSSAEACSERDTGMLLAGEYGNVSVPLKPVRTNFSKDSFMCAAFSALSRRRIMTALFTFNLEVA